MCKTCALSQGKSYSFSSLVLILEKAPDGNNKLTSPLRAGTGGGPASAEAADMLSKRGRGAAPTQRPPGSAECGAGH